MYRASHAGLIRAAAYPRDTVLPTWPDPTDPPQQWLTWLREVWALPGFADAVTQATPDLADQTARALAGEPLTERRLARLIQSTLRYVLRWTSRATPFGGFAAWPRSTSAAPPRSGGATRIAAALFPMECSSPNGWRARGEGPDGPAPLLSDDELVGLPA